LESVLSVNSGCQIIVSDGSLAKDIVTAAQFTIFTLQLFQTLTFSGGEPSITAPGIPLMLATPDTQSLRCTANLWGNGTNYRPL
jgi:hypothetical protein